METGTGVGSARGGGGTGKGHTGIDGDNNNTWSWSDSHLHTVEVVSLVAASVTTLMTAMKACGLLRRSLLVKFHGRRGFLVLR